jgi:hypothetical protein
MATEELLKKELETFEENKEKLLKESYGKFVLIKDKVIIEIFDTQADAIKVGIDKFGNDPFLVKKIDIFNSTSDNAIMY